LLVRPDRQVPTAAIRIHGLLPGELAAAPPLVEQLTALLDRTVGDVLVVHVAEVDQAFLDGAMRRLWGCPLNATLLDTARMAGALNRRLHLARRPAGGQGPPCGWPTWPRPTGCRSTPSTTRCTTP
jgi:DNA polymerase III epsilon subunit-like protein